KRSIFCPHALIATPHELPEPLARNGVVVREDTSAHVIEQHVREVMRSDSFICRRLQAVSLSDNLRKCARAPLNIFLNGTVEVFRMLKLRKQRSGFGLGALHIENHLPLLGSRWCQVDMRR